MDEVKRQREYYEKTANSYESNCCFDENDEHYFACAALAGMLSHFKVNSVLDVGCGTGRAIQYLQPKCPSIKFTGLEPVEALRLKAIENGLNPQQVVDGDATNLAYNDDQFDCVCMFGVLHHIPNPENAIEEALRVAGKMIVISDHNIYGMGSTFTKLLKQLFRDLHMRKLLSMIMTKGKGYHDTDWDGIFYPFSLVDHFPNIQRKTKRLYSMSTKTSAINLYRHASHMCLIGII